jgi:predicted CXXCH cytochrome family protein
VVEDCSICHKPHGSTHDKLLTRKTLYLCQTCHSNRYHPGTLYAIDPSSAGTTVYERLSYRVLYKACLTCHYNIHGSNHPSGKVYSR